MISYIKGELAHIGEDYIIVENGNIGYEIRVPATVLDEMPYVGAQVKVYTYMYVREDVLALYGFLTRDDLSVFKTADYGQRNRPEGGAGNFVDDRSR